MASKDPILALVFFFAIGLVFLLFGFDRLRLKQRIENTPTSKVRSIAMGPVEVSGQIVPSDQGLLEAPFTGTPCVYYEYQVEEYVGGKHRSWKTVASGSEAKRFFIKDDTGQVLVDSTDADIEIPHDFLQVGTRDPPERVQAFLTSKKVSNKGFFGFSKNMRYSEWHLAPDDVVFVTGDAGDNPYVAEGTAVQGVKDILISQGTSEFFFISDTSERKVLDGLKWKVWGGIFGGLAFCAFALGQLFLYWKIF